MKLLSELFAPDSNFKKIKFRYIGEVRKTDDDLYMIYVGSELIGTVFGDNNRYILHLPGVHSMFISVGMIS